MGKAFDLFELIRETEMKTNLSFTIYPRIMRHPPVLFVQKMLVDERCISCIYISKMTILFLLRVRLGLRYCTF